MTKAHTFPRQWEKTSPGCLRVTVPFKGPSGGFGQWAAEMVTYLYVVSLNNRKLTYFLRTAYLMWEKTTHCQLHM